MINLNQENVLLIRDGLSTGIYFVFVFGTVHNLGVRPGFFNIKGKLFRPNELLHALAPHGLCVALITQVPVSRAHAFAE